eukprot:1392344-Amorphochlora_amoeboformis.AAC.2
MSTGSVKDLRRRFEAGVGVEQKKSGHVRRHNGNRRSRTSALSVSTAIKAQKSFCDGTRGHPNTPVGATKPQHCRTQTLFSYNQGSQRYIPTKLTDLGRDFSFLSTTAVTDNSTHIERSLDAKDSFPSPPIQGQFKIIPDELKSIEGMSSYTNTKTETVEEGDRGERQREVEQDMHRRLHVGIDNSVQRLTQPLEDRKEIIDPGKGVNMSEDLEEDKSIPCTESENTEELRESLRLEPGIIIPPAILRETVCDILLLIGREG